MPGDVSSRSYRRIVLPEGESMILVSYPQELRSTCERFHLTTRLLEGNRIRVPTILLSDCQAGRMLLEDVGDVSMFNLADQPWSELEVHLEQAVGIGQRIAQIEPETVAAINPPLDESLLWSELEQTWETFLRPHGLIGSADCSRELEAGLRQLCARLGEEAPQPSHRDFMVRNLFLHGSPRSLVVLDHQDLRLAPRFYDLASLLNDSLFPPRGLESRLVKGLISSEEERLRQIDYLGFQVTEISEADPQPGEDERLAAERVRLANAGRLAQSAGGAEALLYSGEGAVVESLGRAATALGEAARIDSALGESAARIEGAQREIEDVATALRGYAEGSLRRDASMKHGRASRNCSSSFRSSRLRVPATSLSSMQRALNG